MMYDVMHASFRGVAGSLHHSNRDAKGGTTAEARVCAM